jgi:hypothetical protein
MKSELEVLKEQNAILREALQSQIDYHHHIGNEDCPYSTNQVLVTLYKKAKNGLKEANDVTNQKSEIEPA